MKLYVWLENALKGSGEDGIASGGNPPYVPTTATVTRLLCTYARYWSNVWYGLGTAAAATFAGLISRRRLETLPLMVVGTLLLMAAGVTARTAA